MTNEQKNWIDNASYRKLLRKWRHSPVGDPMFQGETGDYYAQVMRAKKHEVGQAAAVQASKDVGWDIV
jgi:hypothetical protein